MRNSKRKLFGRAFILLLAFTALFSFPSLAGRWATVGEVNYETEEDGTIIYPETETEEPLLQEIYLVGEDGSSARVSVSGDYNLLPASEEEVENGLAFRVYLDESQIFKVYMVNNTVAANFYASAKTAGGSYEILMESYRNGFYYMQAKNGKTIYMVGPVAASGTLSYDIETTLSAEEAMSAMNALSIEAFDTASILAYEAEMETAEVESGEEEQGSVVLHVKVAGYVAPVETPVRDAISHAVHLTLILAVAGVWLVLYLLTLSRLFRKVGIPAWHAFFLGLNLYDFTRLSCDKPSVVLWLYIPGINLLVWWKICQKCAAAFDRGPAYGAAIFLLPVPFLSALAFGRSMYMSPEPWR